MKPCTFHFVDEEPAELMCEYHAIGGFLVVDVADGRQLVFPAHRLKKMESGALEATAPPPATIPKSFQQPQ